MIRPDVLQTRLGRRIVSLIILAGLAPLCFFALYIHFASEGIFTEESRNTLAGQARLAVDQIKTTLALAEARLKEAATGMSGRPPRDRMSRSRGAATGTQATAPDVDGTFYPIRRIVRLDAAMNPIGGGEGVPPAWGDLDEERKRRLARGQVIQTRPYAVGSATTVALIMSDGDGGYLAGEVDFVPFWAVTRGTNYGPYDRFWVIDSENRVLASSAPFTPFRRPPGLASDWRLPDGGRAWGDGALSGIESMVWVFEEIHAPGMSPGERWGALVIRHAAAGQAFEDRFVHGLVLFFFLCLGVLILLSMRLARDIHDPVSELAETARALGEGRWSARSQLRRDDEIGDLARTFNGMAEELSRNYEERLRLEGEAVVGRLASQVAHEVNNPLAAIKTWINRLRQHLPESERDIVTRLDEQISRIARTLRSLLNFSRQREMRHARVSAAELLEVIVALFDAAFRVRGVRFEHVIPEDLPSLIADSDQIQEVLVNLLENARSAVSAGGLVRLEARTIPWHDEPDAAIEISVEDDGPGLGGDPELLFRPFFTTRTIGTGLGLTLARRICQDHFGTLHGENRAGTAHGARFVVRLPCFRAPEAAKTSELVSSGEVR